MPNVISILREFDNAQIDDKSNFIYGDSLGMMIAYAYEFHNSDPSIYVRKYWPVTLMKYVKRVTTVETIKAIKTKSLMEGVWYLSLEM